MSGNRAFLDSNIVIYAYSKTDLAKLELHKKHQFSFYDGLIVASAMECQCALLFSEDMQDGQVIQGVTITNPF
ncbi:MAG: hypothetical protein LBR23_04320 [Spirochaetaceae bacterium]|jgi:predicted nucleic acid-binding protein|nr:hypothetical protein [Spirochaetaceae bacterium]